MIKKKTFIFVCFLFGCIPETVYMGVYGVINELQVCQGSQVCQQDNQDSFRCGQRERCCDEAQD